MNVQFPPKQPCAAVWPQFVKWLDVKMGQDSLVSADGPATIPLFNIAFRLHDFAFCPFCGKPFDLTVPIGSRHDS